MSWSRGRAHGLQGPLDSSDVRRPLAKPAHGPAPRDKPRRRNAEQDQLVQGLLLVHKNPNTPLPLFQVCHVLLVCSRSRACQAGNPPGSTKEVCCSLSEAKRVLLGRGPTEGCEQVAFCSVLVAEKIKRDKEAWSVHQILGCKVAEMPLPFLQGPSIFRAISLEPCFSETLPESPQLLLHSLHTGGSLKLPAPGQKASIPQYFSPESMGHMLSLPGCQ